MHDANSARSGYARDREAQHPLDDVAIGKGATSHWCAFIAALERAYRPYGRASHEVRIAARRVARHLTRAQVSPDDIRRELARAVRAQARQPALDDDGYASDGRGFETFLADVLRTAVEAPPSVRLFNLAQNRTGGEQRLNV